MNDITNAKLDLLMKLTPYPEILKEIVALSREHFGWYTKHFSRGIEYPWVTQKVFETLGTNLQGIKLLDVGAGVSPLPLLFSKYGAEVVTIDYSKQIRHIENREQWNEWGFLDYSILDPTITSLNENIFESNLAQESFDLVYSVSVIEHMPKQFRLGFFQKSRKLIKKNGNIILTLDVIPYTNNLWNLDRGKVVEDVAQHGDLITLEAELSHESFKIDKVEAYRSLETKTPDLFLLHAVLSNSKSDNDKIEYYRSFTTNHPDHGKSYFDWGLVLLKSNRFIEAQGVINKAVEINSAFCDSNFVFNTYREQLQSAFEMCKSWSWPAVQLGAGYLRHNQLSKAEAYLQNMVQHRLVANYYTYGRGFEYLCQILFKRNGSNRKTAHAVKEICLKDIDKNGKHHWSSLYLGAALTVEGKLGEAYHYFEEASNSSFVSSFTHSGKGCLSLKHYRNLNTQEEQENQSVSWFNKYSSEITFYDEPKHLNESCILLVTCCDSKYFVKFSETLIKSCFQNNSDVSLHFHIVNPEQSTFEIWQSLKESISEARISFSYENIDIKNLKVYYTMVRFLRIVEFIERYNKDIIIVDSDSVVTNKLSPLAQTARKFDVCLNIKQDDNYFPWRSIVANLVFASATEKSKIFFTAISRYLKIVFQPNTDINFWWIDQNALFAAYHWCQEFQSSIKIGNIWELGKSIPFDFALASHQKKESFVSRYTSLLGINRNNIYHNKKSQNEELSESTIHEFKDLINVNPESSHFYKILGDRLTREGRVGQAIASYKIATYKENLKWKPKFVQQYWNQGKIVGPNFLVIGAAKGGTNSIFQYLNLHPQVLPCASKEINFYHRYARGILSHDWYLAHFPPMLADKGFQTGEASAATLYKNVQEQVKQLYPGIQLIALLRNPVERTVSHYYHFIKVSREFRSIEEAIDTELSLLENLSEDELSSSPDNGYIRQSLYVYQLKRWMTCFSEDQFLILKSEDLFTKPTVVMENIFNFLGLSNYHSSQYHRYNAGSYSPISPELRFRLAEFFDSHNQKLEEYLGLSFNWDMTQ